jgi:hypothetical protein
MAKKYKSIILPNIKAMMTGVYFFEISPRKISIRYTDGAVETRKGAHTFHCFVEGDTITDNNFDPFKIVSWVQAARRN